MTEEMYVLTGKLARVLGQRTRIEIPGELIAQPGYVNNDTGEPVHPVPWGDEE